MKVPPIVRRVVLPLAVFALVAWFLPWLALLYAVCGLYDVSRNRALDPGKIRQYFTGNGFFTWVLSPFNTLLDILSLPYLNKGVYKLDDLPPDYRDEIARLIRISREEDLVGRLEQRSAENRRTMIFFKWYGANVDTFIDIPAFHEKWKYVETIGVSVFNRKVSTSRHFGYVRASLRVLYNLNDMSDRSAYIVVGDVTQYWIDDKLFIFDDTLLHQSFNDTDQTRYCLFVDILRPSPVPAVMRAVTILLRQLSGRVNQVFYKNWKIITR